MGPFDIILLGIALSMDAFAVGVSLRAVGADILSSSLIIAAATFLVCLAALRIGRASASCSATVPRWRAVSFS